MQTRDVFEVAYELAQHYHFGQMYGSKPYMYHIDAVINSVKRKWGEHNRDILAIAALHDIIEDTKMTEELLTNLVGKDVTRCVVALSKLEGEDYLAYIFKVRQHHYSKEVKIHDTLVNLTESIMADSKSRVKKYAKQLDLLLVE